MQAEQDSEYSSDEDECTSDQDDRGPAYESDDDDGYDRIANDDLDALMRCFDDKDAALIALARHLESLPHCLPGRRRGDLGHQELAGLQKQRIYMRETQSQSFTHTKENLTHGSRPSQSQIEFCQIEILFQIDDFQWSLPVRESEREIFLEANKNFCTGQ